MQTKAMAPSREVAAALPERLAQERREGLRGHLTRRHGELAMAGLAQAADVTVNRDVVGRVGEDQVRTLVSHEGADRLSVSGVAADEPVSSQRPNIAETGHGRVLVGQGRDLVLAFRRGAWGALFGVVQENVDFGEGEAGELDVELNVNEGLELDRQDIAVPAGVLRKLVVGDHIGAALRLGQVRQPERRDALNPEELCCLDPAMAGDDLVLIADEDRVGETEALDASGDLLDLLLGVGASVFGVGTQVPDAHGLNGHVRHDFLSRFLGGVWRRDRASRQ